MANRPGQGRKPKPTAMKRLAGNPGKRPLNENEPKFQPITDVEPPHWLEGDALRMWYTVVPELLKAQVLTVVDIAAVESYCMAYHRWREAEKEITNKGVVVTGAQGGPVKNPACAVAKTSKDEMAKFGAMLGLDPSSRTRLVGAVPKETKRGNDFDEF